MDAWPWLAVAGLGVLHGLSPAGGWVFVAARDVQPHGAASARHALLPLAAGHVASIAVVAGLVSQGLAPDRGWARDLAGALLLAVAWQHGRGRAAPCHGGAGLALWSFLMATAHGAGLMLVPALVPLCLSDSPARAITASGSLGLALAAVGVHLAAMLATTVAVAAGVCRGLAWLPRRRAVATNRCAGTALLAATGALLLGLR